jgi:DNA-binding GntR family transcriptional regulator
MTTDDGAPRRPLPGGIGYVYVQLADDIAGRIRDGEFPRGTRLPGRQRLAAEYGVAEMTVRRALRELAGRGIVASEDSRGALVIRAGTRPDT